MIYLSSPYSHPDQAVVEARIKTFCKVDEALQRKGLMTVSPLYKHLLFLNGSTLPSDWNYWKCYSRVLLKECDWLFVIKNDGWEESIGVQAEIEFAKERLIPIEYLNPADYDN